jgi:predicted nucleotidyltransferase
MKNNIISELEIALKQKLNNDLLSVILFGSIVKGNFTNTSDIDVLVICETPPKDWRARDKMVLELTENIEIKYGTPIHMTLVSKEEILYSIESISPLMLEIYSANEIIYDKDSFFKQLLKHFEKNMHRLKAQKIEDGVWKIPGLAVIESG